MVYIIRFYILYVTLAANIFLDFNILILDIIQNSLKIQLVNIYNEIDELNIRLDLKTLDWQLLSFLINQYLIVLSNFNLYYF